MKRTILKVLIVTFIVSAVLGIGIILLDIWNEVTAKILLSTVTIFSASIPGLCCSISYEKSTNKTVPFIGMIACSISCLYFLLLIWELLTFKWFDEFAWDFMSTCILVPITFAHISLLLLIDSDDSKVNGFKIGTIALAILMDILILIEIYGNVEMNWKLMLILSILIALGTIVTPLMHKLSSKPSARPINPQDKYKQLEQLKALLDSNAITQQEYEIEKNRILNS